jgi:hypothetical protein
MARLQQFVTPKVAVYAHSGPYTSSDQGPGYKFERFGNYVQGQCESTFLWDICFRVQGQSRVALLCAVLLPVWSTALLAVNSCERDGKLKTSYEGTTTAYTTLPPCGVRIPYWDAYTTKLDIHSWSPDSGVRNDIVARGCTPAALQVPSVP